MKSSQVYSRFAGSACSDLPIRVQRYHLSAPRPTRRSMIGAPMPAPRNTAVKFRNVQSGVLDGWRLEERLGSGAMAAVFRATHVKSRIIGAVKVMMSSLPGEVDGARRLRREVLVLAKL